MKFASRDTLFQHKYSNINSSCIFFLPLSDNFGQLKFLSTKYGFGFFFFIFIFSPVLISVFNTYLCLGI